MTPTPIALHGRTLRAALVLHLRGVAPNDATVSELVDALARRGFAIDGRPSKAVSDHLRSDVSRGYVVRVTRGRYRFGRVPRTSLWRMEDRLRRIVGGLAPRRYG